MYYIALLLPICYIAGVTGASIPTQWALLSLSLPLGLWRPTSTLVLRWLGGLFVLYVPFTGVFVVNWYTAVLGLWYIFIWALAFHWGTTMPTLIPMWKGLAIGLSISSLVAGAQALGFPWPATVTPGTFPGLLFNPVVQGMCCAIVILGLAGNHLWHYMPLLCLGLTLSQSRGGWLVIGLTTLARMTHWTLALLALAVGALLFMHFAGDSDIQRLRIWGIALHGLTALGWGPDSFNDIFAIIPDAQGRQMVHLEFAHNDYLQLLFEFGIGALPLFAILACCLTRTQHSEWPALFALAVAATFFFPLYCPTTAFILCAVAGHIAVDWDRVWGVRIRCRLDLLSRTPRAQRIAAVIWS